MRDIVKRVLSGILVLVFCMAMLVGCASTDNGAISDRLDSLEKDLDDVKRRLDKLEATVVSLEELTSLVNKYPELTNKLEELTVNVKLLQDNLIANTVADNEMKTQVTAMQSKLDKFYYDGTESIDLSKTQAMLDKVYGQVIQDEYKMGDIIEVKYNGIHYYTIQIVGEYHDGRVFKETTDEQVSCKLGGGPKHWCGQLVFTNYIFHEVAWTTMQWELIFASLGGGGKMTLETYDSEPGNVGGKYNPIKYGETKKLFWQLIYGFVEGVPFNINFGLARGYAGEQDLKFRFVAARIKNFYDGVQRPIVATP